MLFQPLQGGHKAEMMMPRFEDEVCSNKLYYTGITVTTYILFVLYIIVYVP